MDQPKNVAMFDFTDEKDDAYRLVVISLPKSELILTPGMDPLVSDTSNPKAWLDRVVTCLRSLDGVSTQALQEDPVLSDLGQAMTDLGITLGQLYTVVKANLGEARARTLVHGLANHVLDHTAIWGTAKDGTNVVVHQGEAAAASPGEES